MRKTKRSKNKKVVLSDSEEQDTKADQLSQHSEPDP